MVDFRAVIDVLWNIGVYDIILPFILVYAITFAILEKSGIFQSKDTDKNQVKNVNAVIAFVFGMFVVASYNTVIYIQNLIVNIVVVIIFLLCILILLGLIFGDEYTKLLRDKEGNMHGWVVWGISSIVVLVALGILFWVLGIWDWVVSYFEGVGTSDTLITIVAILAIIGILVWITSSGDKSSEKS